MKLFGNLFQGRINRLTYFFGIFLLTFIAIAGSMFLYKILTYQKLTLFLLAQIPLYGLCGMYYYSFIVRRRHDTNSDVKSFVPTNAPFPSRYNRGGGIIFLYLFYLGIAKGEPQDNQYGSPPPKGIGFYALLFGNKKREIIT